MEKKYFLLKLVGPRPTFVTDMTEAEQRVMMEHAAYVKGYVDRGTVIVTGPVLDPKGPWGVAVLEVDSKGEVRSIIANDPATLSGLGFRYEVYPMLRAAVRK
jgi:uncharacterized protein